MLQFKLQQSLFVVDSTRDVNNCCDIHHIYFPLWIYSIEPNNFTTSEEKKCKIFIILSIGTAAKRSFISVQRVFFFLLSFHRRNNKNVPKKHSGRPYRNCNGLLFFRHHSQPGDMNRSLEGILSFKTIKYGFHSTVFTISDTKTK